MEKQNSQVSHQFLERDTKPAPVLNRPRFLGVSAGVHVPEVEALHTGAYRRSQREKKKARRREVAAVTLTCERSAGIYYRSDQSELRLGAELQLFIYLFYFILLYFLVRDCRTVTSGLNRIFENLSSDRGVCL